jgi:hypothetical protein
MLIKGYEIVIEIDGVENFIEINDLYPSITDWKTASDFAMMLAHEINPDATDINFVECNEYQLDEYKKYPYIYPAPFSLQ